LDRWWLLLKDYSVNKNLNAGSDNDRRIGDQAPAAYYEDPQGVGRSWRASVSGTSDSIS